MIVSPWSQLSETEQEALSPKLAGLSEHAAERFDQFVIEYDKKGTINHSATNDNLLTIQNFATQAEPFWHHIAAIKGIQPSYLELTVQDRTEFLRELAKLDYVINREPFWTIHKFDSARETTEYSRHPALHFANDRANETDYGPNYFFVHWDNQSPWFRKSDWPLNWLPGARLAEQLYAGFQHRYGCACPQTVRDHLARRQTFS
jgi:hypothetical protein